MTQVQVVGQPLIIGENTAQMTTAGKVRITNASGKTKDISVKSFQKQLVKNADKINNGDNFEFQTTSTGKKVAAGVGIIGAIAGLTAAIIYRKNIGQFIKNTNLKELGKDLYTKGKNFLSEGWEATKTFATESWGKARDLGKSVIDYIKEIPSKFAKTK